MGHVFVDLLSVYLSLDVLEILDRWLAPDYRYFKVAAGDGNTYVLRHDERSGEWTLGAYRKGTGLKEPPVMPVVRGGAR